MGRLHFCLMASCIAILFSLPIELAFAFEYYVAVDGDNDNPGTIDLPFSSIARGQEAASPGDTVWIRGGIYEFVGGARANPDAVLFNKSGTRNRRINYWAYPGETPVFDFFNYMPQAQSDGFSVQADYLHFKGLEIRGVRQQIQSAGAGIRIEGGGDYNIFEQLDIHHNQGLGLWIADGGYNLVLNSDSHHNYDPLNGGGDSDGFGTRNDKPGNVFIGDRAWDNSDDGFDFILSRGVVLLENSWAWHNGYIPDTDTAAGNGAGVKAGGFLLDPEIFPDPEDVPRHVIRNSVAFDNRAHGFYANHHPGGLDFINDTAFDNRRGFNLRADVETETWPAHHFLRNNISYYNNNNNSNLTNATQEDIDDEFNTWNAGFSVSDADFVSLIPDGVDGPRQADGSLPDIDFLKLALDSGLIDAGTDVGLPFVGTAPELGAFESLRSGDYNGDGIVNAADYTVWLAGLGTIFTQQHFDLWKMNFGMVVPGGGSVAAAVPEPGAIVWAPLLAVAGVLRRARRR